MIKFRWKTAYAVILANSEKSVCSHLFGCGKVDFEQLVRENIYRLMLVSALVIVRTAVHMNLNITDWFTQPAQVLREFQLRTFQFECDTQAYWAIRNSLYYIWQSDRAMTRVPSTWKKLTSKCHFHKWSLLAFPPAFSYFDLQHYLWKNIKIRL